MSETILVPPCSRNDQKNDESSLFFVRTTCITHIDLAHLLSRNNPAYTYDLAKPQKPIERTGSESGSIDLPFLIITIIAAPSSHVRTKGRRFTMSIKNKIGLRRIPDYPGALSI